MRAIGRAALVLVASTSLLATTPAWAGGPSDPVGGETPRGTVAGLKYVSETLQVGSSGHYSPPYDAAWVACGGHASPFHPTSGGAQVNGDQADNLIAVLRPTDLDAPLESPPNNRPDDWWDSTVKSVVGRDLTGYAICTKRATRYVQVTADDDTSGDRVATAHCPDGFSLIGGGGFIASTDSYLNSGFPVRGTSWRVRVHDTTGGLGGLEAYAVCRQLGDVFVNTGVNAEIQAGTAEAAVARCPNAWHVIGGGGRLTGPIGEAHLAASLPVDGPDADNVPDDRWRVVGYNGAGNLKKLNAYAICVKRG